MDNNREKTVIRTSIISILAKIFDEVQEQYKDYKININLDVDISD